MNFSYYERDQGFVIAKLENGEFDYIDSADEVAECDFFRYISAGDTLDKLAQSYPTPRKKEPEVPYWFFLASNLSMRLHGVHAFNAFPFVVRSGGMINAFGPDLGKKTVDPDTGDTTIVSRGFNDKNVYDRETPCDPDFLRKLAHDTDAKKLLKWYNIDVVKTLHQQNAFDPEGIIIGDASYLFVPDNDNYEKSVKLLFGPDGYPVESDNISAETKQQCVWRRCYKLVSLLHLSRTKDYFIYAGLAIVPGNAHEAPVIYKLVDTLVETVGKGVIKRLIVDRGLIDGQNIGRIKRDYAIDTLVPLKRNMRLYREVLDNLDSPDIPFQSYQEPQSKPPPPPPNRPKHVQQREQKRQETIAAKKKEEPPPPPEKQLIKREVAGFEKWRSLDSCPIPVNVVVNRETYADGTEKIWMLLDTAPIKDPAATRNNYALRTCIEERYRQHKGFADLTKFTSQKFSMVTNHVVFTLLAYSLFQLFLAKEEKRPELNRKTMPTVRDMLLPTTSHVIVYCENYFAFITPIELADIIINLEGEARKRARARIQACTNQLAPILNNPRPRPP